MAADDAEEVKFIFLKVLWNSEIWQWLLVYYSFTLNVLIYKSKTHWWQQPQISNQDWFIKNRTDLWKTEVTCENRTILSFKTYLWNRNDLEKQDSWLKRRINFKTKIEKLKTELIYVNRSEYKKKRLIYKPRLFYKNKIWFWKRDSQKNNPILK